MSTQKDSAYIMALQKTLSADTRTALDAVSQLASAYFPEPTVKAYSAVKTLIGDLGTKLAENKVIIVAAEPGIFYSGKKRLCRALGMNLAGSNDIKAVLSMDYIPTSEQYEIICGFPKSAKIFPSHDGLFSGFAVSSPTGQHIIYIPLDPSRLGVILREDMRSYLNEVTERFNSVDFNVVAIEEEPAQAEAFNSYTAAPEEPVSLFVPEDAPPVEETAVRETVPASAPEAAAEKEEDISLAAPGYIASILEISVSPETVESENIPVSADNTPAAEETPVFDFDNFVFETVELDDDGSLPSSAVSEPDPAEDTALAISTVAPDMLDSADNGEEEDSEEEDSEEETSEEVEEDNEDEKEEPEEEYEEEDYTGEDNKNEKSSVNGDPDIIPVMIPDSVSDELPYPEHTSDNLSDEFRINPDTLGVSAPSAPVKAEPDSLEALVANVAKVLKEKELTVAIAPTGPFNAFGNIVNTEPDAGKRFIQINPSDFEESAEGKLYERCAQNAGKAAMAAGLGVALTPIEPADTEGEYIICFAVADDKNADGTEITGTDPTEMSRDCVTKLLKVIEDKAKAIGADEGSSVGEEATIPAEVVKSRIPLIIGAAAVILAIIISVVIAMLKSGAPENAGTAAQSAAAIGSLAANTFSMFK